MSEETLSIRLDDGGTPQTAAQSADALEYLLKAVERFGQTEADGAERATKVFERLGVAGKRAGSAIAAGISGTLDSTLRAVAGVTKLSSVLDLATKRATALKKEEDAAFKKAVEVANRTPDHLKAGPAKGEVSTFAAVTGLVGKLFGPQAASGLVTGAGKLAEASEKLGPYMPLLKGGGELLLGGGKLLAIGAAAVGAAAAALVLAAGALAYKLLHAGAELAIKATTFREETEGALEAVLKNAQEARDTYEAGIKIAVELGLDKEETLQRVKSLVTSGFRGEDVTVVVRAVADFRVAKGDEAANALQKGLEKIKTKGLFNQEALNSLAESGLQADLVIRQLATKLGLSVEQVKGKLKAGQIDVATGVQAILAAAQEQTGGAAEKAAKSLPALAASAKTLFESLFDQVDLGPIKEVLGTLKKLLGGPEGEAIRSAASKLFGSLFKTLFGAFQGKEGEARLQRLLLAVATAMEAAATVIERAGPTIIRIVDALINTFDLNGAGASGSWIEGLFRGMVELNPVNTLLGWLGDLTGFHPSAIIASLFQTGVDIVQGLIDGIISKTQDVINAVVSVVSGGVAAARGPKGADAHSPSRKFDKVGSDSGEGLVVGMMRWHGKAATTAESLVNRATGSAIRAANDNGLDTAAAPAGRNDVGVGGQVINVTFHVQVSSAAGRERADGEKIADAGYQQFQKHMTRFLGGQMRRVGT